jgi:hypothetical protein
VGAAPPYYPLPDDPAATSLQHAAGSVAPMHCTTAAHVWCPDAADQVGQLARLSRLSHLDLGCARGVVALAPRLPALQSLALDLSAEVGLASTAPCSCRQIDRCPLGCSKADGQCSIHSGICHESLFMLCHAGTDQHRSGLHVLRVLKAEVQSAKHTTH